MITLISGKPCFRRLALRSFSASKDSFNSRFSFSSFVLILRVLEIGIIGVGPGNGPSTPNVSFFDPDSLPVELDSSSLEPPKVIG